jgi:hypothetical protein
MIKVDPCGQNCKVFPSEFWGRFKRLIGLAGISSEEEKIGRENLCEPNSPTRDEIEVLIPFRVE